MSGLLFQFFGAFNLLDKLCLNKSQDKSTAMIIDGNGSVFKPFETGFRVFIIPVMDVFVSSLRQQSTSRPCAFIMNIDCRLNFDETRRLRRADYNLLYVCISRRKMPSRVENLESPTNRMSLFLERRPCFRFFFSIFIHSLGFQFSAKQQHSKRLVQKTNPENNSRT